MCTYTQRDRQTHLDVGACALSGPDEAVDDIIRPVVKSAAADRRKRDRRGSVLVRHLQTRADHRAQLLHPHQHQYPRRPAPADACVR